MPNPHVFRMKSRFPGPWQIGFGLLVLAFSAGGWWLRFSAAQAEAVPSENFFAGLADAATAQTRQAVRYDPSYVVIPYPGGDVPAETGVCSDVVVRAYRHLRTDLQERVHVDMKANFTAYPALWGLKKTDPNIDHRRVPNLQTFFKRHGGALAVTDRKEDYRVGDLVAWDLNGNGLWHIGIVTGEDRFVHNIGAGPEVSTGLFTWKVVGHYRWQPSSEKTP